MSASQPVEGIWRRDFVSMGCPCSIQIEVQARERAEVAFAAAIAELDRLERKYSHYRDDSLLAQWCAAAGSGEAVELDAESADLLDLASLLHEQSGGAFDISAGALARLWAGPGDALPNPAEIAQAMARGGWRHLVWQRPWLRLEQPGMRLDLGSLVKEYAADRAAALCREQGLMHGIVELGGDLSVVGPHVDGTPWRAGVRHPRLPAALAGIELLDGGLATSGDYERGLLLDGKRYGHIVDPRTGWPVTAFASVSVLAPNCLVAGAAATLAMLLGVDAGARYLSELGLPHLTVSAAGRIGGTVAWIEPDSRV
ncbi:MAG: FAD:protein FMN transferase [Xanthomonadales bacterium]|nr:FAD:protein FMN transferase [Xanthomonadales bacterium]MCP5475031.1 FAD:protein FMN transferase [Rhodanobacteraceae bacterium]